MSEEKIKPSYDEKRQVLGEIYPLSTPFTVILDVSERCNFRCNYCFRGQEDKEKWGYAAGGELMRDETFRLAIDQIKDFPEQVKQISLSNHGEPLCNPRVPDMVRYIKERGIESRVSIHTNAAMLTEEYARNLADSNIDRVVVSLQGLNSKKYKESCGANIDFETFYRNIQILSQNKKDTQLYFKIMDVALDDGEEAEFYEKFLPIGDRVFIEHIVPIWKDVDLSGIREKKKMKNKYGQEFPIQESCALIFNTIVVSPVGDVYPCTQLLTPYKLGNIQEHSLVEFWNSRQRKELLIRQCEGKNPNICSECYIKQNSIFSMEDCIDDYRQDILNRIITTISY